MRNTRHEKIRGTYELYIMSIFNTKTYGAGLPGIATAMQLTPLHMQETTKRQLRLLRKWYKTRGLAIQSYYSKPRVFSELQLNRLSYIVEWAYRHCPFYRDIYHSAGYRSGDIRSFQDFKCLPTVSKSDLVEQFPAGVVSTKHDLSRVRWMSTSGSSGQQVQMILTEGRSDRDMMFKFRMFEIQSSRELSPHDWLYNIHYVPWWHSSLDSNYKVFSIKPECTPDQLLCHIKYLRPSIISCLGSELKSLFSLSSDMKNFGVRLISTNSEHTASDDRLDLSNTLGIPVLDEYSSEELDIIAFECPQRKYHVNEDDVYVELLDSEDVSGIGHVVGTDLWNTAMPVIRYRQNDLAEWAEGPSQCGCGSYFRQLKTVQGRADQNFTSATGKIIRTSILLDLVEKCFCIDPVRIREFRVIQISTKKIEILYVPKDNILPESFFYTFTCELERLFGHPLTVSPAPLCAIPDTPSFKRRTFISKVPYAKL